MVPCIGPIQVTGDYINKLNKSEIRKKRISMCKIAKEMTKLAPSASV